MVDPNGEKVRAGAERVRLSQESGDASLRVPAVRDHQPDAVAPPGGRAHRSQVHILETGEGVVKLADAPVVEGAVAAAVVASMGLPLDDVVKAAEEARDARKR